MIKFAIILSLAVSNARASDNGKYYTCDTSILESDNQCIFDLTGEHQIEINKEVVQLEKAPKIAVYTPPNKQPWDDAVTMVLEYAEIPYDKIYDMLYTRYI